MEKIDLSRSQTFQIQNNVYVLGNPVVDVPTLELLVQELDHAGEGQPIVIISPEAKTIPDLSDRLSVLIQNNRRMQPMNVTTEDKYHFMNKSDEELQMIVDALPGINDKATMLYMYQGLRARSQARYSLDMCLQERDYIWSRHCADPTSNEGFDRYNELVSTIIPQWQAEYDRICKELERLDAEHLQNNERVVEEVVEEAVEETPVHEEPQVEQAAVCSGTEHEMYAEWRSFVYMNYPMSVAKSMSLSAAYREINAQQVDTTVDGVTYKAVPTYLLLALGIKLFNDGVPVVYTNNGKFKRIGKSDVSMLNLKYWYPEPER